MLGQLHPFIVHFAVALLLVAPVCDSLGMLMRREALLQAGRWNTLFGVGAAALAALTGLSAQAHAAQGGAGASLLQLHKALGLLLLAVWLPLALWRGALARVSLPLRLRTLYLTGSFVGAAIVLVQAGLGSTLVYRHGTGLSASARVLPPPPTPAAPTPPPTRSTVSGPGGAR